MSGTRRQRALVRRGLGFGKDGARRFSRTLKGLSFLAGCLIGCTPATADLQRGHLGVSAEVVHAVSVKFETNPRVGVRLAAHSNASIARRESSGPCPNTNPQPTGRIQRCKWVELVF